jgi:hypothetical protein
MVNMIVVAEFGCHDSRRPDGIFARRYCTDGMTLSAGNIWPSSVGGQGTAMN